MKQGQSPAIRACVAAILGGTGLQVFVAPASAQEDAGLQEVQITGSRILRRDFESPSPIVTVGTEQLEETSNVALEASLNKLPQFVPALSQLITGDIQPTAVNTPGSATVNLRGLGTNRNIVIIDGRRAMPVNASLSVDLNSIPSAAVERVEIITGGASSTYGADAVGGVVNFILKKNFQGIEFDSQYGMTEAGDAEEFRLSGVIGGNFGEGERGNVMFGAEYSKRGDARLRDHDWAVERWRNPAIAGTDFFWSGTSWAPPAGNSAAAQQLQPSQAALSSLFTNAPAGANIPRGSVIYLNPDGSVYSSTGQASVGSATTADPFNPGGNYRYNGPLDGEFRKRQANGALGQNDLEAYLSTPLDRYSLFGRARFEFNEDLSYFIQGTLAQTNVETRSQYINTTGARAAAIPFGTGRNCVTIGVLNGVCQDTDAAPAGTLPYAQRQTLPAYRAGGSAGLTCAAIGGCTNSQAFPVPSELALLLASRPNANAPWNMSEVFDWLPRRETTNNSTTYQIITGLEGKLPVRDWTWEAYASHGQSIVSTVLTGGALDRWRELATMPNYGRGATLQQNLNEIANGIPQPGGGSQGATVNCTSGLPLLTDFQVSADCVAALTVNLQSRQKMEQTVYEANVQGGIVEGWAGEIRYAAGMSYRKNEFQYLSDNLVSNNNFIDSAIGIFPAGDALGATTAREVYAEFLVPLVKDVPVFKQLDLELGYRYSDYDPSGAVGTYKGLIDWQVTSFLRFRGGHQFASRAPNVGELFQGRTQTLGVVSPPTTDYCSLVSTSNKSANPAANPNAAAARALCESMMGAQGATAYYDPARQQVATGAGFAQAEGNPALEEEEAKTWTAGVVVGIPTDNDLLRNLRFTVDYYSIDLTKAIATPTGDLVQDRCFDTAFNPTLTSTNVWCDQMRREPDLGTLAVTNVQYSNESSIETAGYDVQVDWRAGLDAMGISAIPGSLSVNVQASILDKFLQRLSSTSGVLDWKGALGPNTVGAAGLGASYDYRLFATLGYNQDNWGLSLRYRYMPSITSANEVTNPGGVPGGDPIPTGAPAYSIFDMSARWEVTDTISIRGGIDNLFDRDPPITGINTIANNGMNGGTFMPAGGGLFDLLGRRYYVGLRARF